MISIIIPVYKNYRMFFKNLTSNKKFFKDCEVIVMNDYPQEKIAGRVTEIIPDAIAIDNKTNLGFSGNSNAGIRLAKGDYIFLMNSDVILIDDSFKKVIQLFEKDREIFAVSFSQIESDGKLVGANLGYFKDGLIYHNHRLTIDNKQPTTNLWAEGGSSIFRRNLFLELDGFDSLYNPFYWEDIDVSYRAWKIGYKVLYYPQVKVQHHHESTIGKYFQKSSILKTAYRNQFIFNWKNLTDSDLITQHLFQLPWLLIRSLFAGNWTLIQGFLFALVKLPQIVKSRQKTVKLFKITDKEILNQFSDE